MNLLQKYTFRIIKQPLRVFSQEISLFLMIFSLCCYVGVNRVEEKGVDSCSRGTETEKPRNGQEFPVVPGLLRCKM